MRNVAETPIAQIIGQCVPFASFNYTPDPETGFPSEADCLSNDFAKYYQTPEVASAWGHFFSRDDIQAQFRAYWSVVATAFAGAPGVLGYDLINEPLGGNLFSEVEESVSSRVCVQEDRSRAAAMRVRRASTSGGYRCVVNAEGTDVTPPPTVSGDHPDPSRRHHARATPILPADTARSRRSRSSSRARRTLSCSRLAPSSSK